MPYHLFCFLEGPCLCPPLWLWKTMEDLVRFRRFLCTRFWFEGLTRTAFDRSSRSIPIGTSVGSTNRSQKLVRAGETGNDARIVDDNPSARLMHHLHRLTIGLCLDNGLFCWFSCTTCVNFGPHNLHIFINLLLQCPYVHLPHGLAEALRPVQGASWIIVLS